jgi:PAS domain S-box-containing protein
MAAKWMFKSLTVAEPGSSFSCRKRESRKGQKNGVVPRKDPTMKASRILIIDDEKAVRDSFGAHLEDCGYEILTAVNGREGISVYEEELPDLIIVDLRMPEVDGIQVLETISKRSPLTPLIVASGTGIITDAIEALHCGAWDYLLKPIEDLSILTHAVEAALEKGQLRKENQAYRRHLEQLVEERTAELEQANNHLSEINTRLRHIVDTTRSLSFCSEVHSFGSLLLEEFGQHMLASGGSIYLKEENGLRLIHSLDLGHAADFIPFPLPENSLFQQAIAAKQPILIHNIADYQTVEPSGWQGYTDGSALMFPLPDEFGGITGIMTLHSKTPPPFLDQDREIGTILASYSCEALRAVRATEELRESASRFRKILDTIPTGIIIVDAETHRIVYTNPAAAGMVGTDPQAITGKACDELFCLTESDICPMDAAKETDQAQRALRALDGREIPILKTVSRTTLEGRECYMESFIDLSERLRAEADKENLETQLRQVQKMEALGTLAGGIAHDFNNILSAVLGYSELGLQDLDDRLHPLYPKLKAINNAGLRARDLVEQILAFSRMQEQMHAPVKVSPIVKEAIKLLQSSLPANIRVKATIKADRPVLGDPTQIHQIIMNLCTNAYHAMQSSGGELGVTLEQVAVDGLDSSAGLTLAPGQYLRLAISDTGSGISPAIIERIFEPYFTTKDKSKGTGLGLAVVHGIVKGHGGKIEVQSRVGEGTCFTVYLPVSHNKTADNGGHPIALPVGTEHILLVDDEKDIVEIGDQMLQRLGYRVSAIVGSTAALKVFKEDPFRFDIVITDYNMPEMTGDQMAKQMLAIRRQLPIIVCTGFSEIFDQQRAQTIGIRKTLMKPVTMEALAQAVREVLASD